MKFYNIFFSPTGGTKKVADIVAKGTKLDVDEIDLIKEPDKLRNVNFEKGDLCLVAEANNEIVGAVWCRIMNDYGHIDAETPSFAISLLKQYRNYGIGTNLMEQMLKKLKMQGYKQVSLSVQKMNYAVHMYLKVGFEIVDENDEEYIMICKL